MTHVCKVEDEIRALAMKRGYVVLDLVMTPSHNFNFPSEVGANFDQMTAGAKRLSEALRGVEKVAPL